MMKYLQSKNEKLLEENQYAKDAIVRLNDITFSKLNKIEELKDRIQALTMGLKTLTAAIIDLGISEDDINKVLKESMLSLGRNCKLRHESRSQDGMKKMRLDECQDIRNNFFRRFIKNKKKEEEMERKREEKDELNKKEEDKLNEEEAIIQEKRQSMRDRDEDVVTMHGGARPSNDTHMTASAAVFTPLPYTESIHKFIVKAGCCRYRYGLDISKDNFLAVVHDYKSVYLYSETRRAERLLFTFSFNVYCLAWNQQGTYLAIGGKSANNAVNTITVWDVVKPDVVRILNTEEKNQDCFSLAWKEGSVTAGTCQYVYQWDVSDLNHDQHERQTKNVFPNNKIQNMADGWIRTAQWSINNSKLATITNNGNMCIYNKDSTLIHDTNAHGNLSFPLLQWCPWDDQVIATCCNDGFLKIWTVKEEKITLSTQVHCQSAIYNIKWIQRKNAILSAHENKVLVLWGYPHLNILHTLEGHTDIPDNLALNADQSAIVSKSNKDMVFWRPFDALWIQSNS